MKELVRNRFLYIILGSLAFFLLLAIFTHDDPLLIIIRVLQGGLWTIVLVAYGAEAFRLMKRGEISEVALATTGIALAALYHILYSFWLLLWRLMGQPRDMVNNDYIGFVVWMSVVAAILLIGAPGAVGGVIPRRTWLVIGTTFGIGIVIGSSIVAFNPEIAHWIAGLIGY